MAKAPSVPDPQDKVGKKIDYLAARLGQALAEHGFKRAGRNCVATVGEGVQQHWQIVNLQSGKWNSGPAGDFYVNVSLQFPAVIAVLAKAPDAQWRNEFITKPDEAAGQMRARLEQLVRSASEGEATAAPSFEDKISVNIDLSQMADRLIAAVQRYALPWLQQHARVEAVRDRNGSLMTVSADSRIAAALALDDIAGAQRLLDLNRGHLETLPETALANKRKWLEGWPLDLSAMPRQPAPRAPDAWTLRQEAKAKAEEATHEAEAAALRTQLNDEATPDADADIPTLAQAWMAEYKARWRSEPEPLRDLPSGPRVAALDSAARERLLLALLKVLVTDEAGRQPNLSARAEAFGHDEAVQPLVKALLTTLTGISEATGHQLFDAFTRLCTRIDQDLITGRFTWAFASLVDWLDKIAKPQRQALKPDVQAWLQRFAESAVARQLQWEEETRRELAKPLNPNSLTYDAMVESRAQMAALVQADNTDLLRRLREYPEQGLASEDKRAVGMLRRWLRRDALTDAVPLAFEPDDWGGPTQQAWDALPAHLRESLLPAIEWLADTAATKPTKRWLIMLDQHRAAVPDSEAPAWRDWLLQRLQAFDQTEGKTEWATTGARPGVGARLGDTSEAVLTGLLWWAWRESAIPREDLVPMLQTTAQAAWRHLDGSGARAPGIGGLALQMLASCGPVGHDWVMTQKKASKKKQFQRAIEQALGNPLS